MRCRLAVILALALPSQPVPASDACSNRACPGARRTGDLPAAPQTPRRALCRGRRDDAVIEVSGDVGWIAVNTRAVGTERSSGRSFDDQWAWIMTVRKIDGRWLHTANASNRQE